MLEKALPDLTFDGLPYGTHETPWNLRVLLYRGGAGTRRNRVEQDIADGKLGRLLQERLPLIEKLFGVIAAGIAAGAPKVSSVGALTLVFSFFAWADEAGYSLTLDSTFEVFRAWTDALIDRVRIKKDLSHMTARQYATRVANILAPCLGISGVSPSPMSRMGSAGSHLLRQTRMNISRKKNSVLGTQADKQNLQDTFAFGHLLVDVCQGLDLSAVRGSLPVVVRLRDGRSVRLKCKLTRPDTAPEEMKNSEWAESARKLRAPLGDDESVLVRRAPLLNRRIEAELLMFIGQTGMNLAQAAALRREDYRWKTEGEDALAFRVYKGRRSGEAVFRAFKVYREHLQKYLDWLGAAELAAGDDRLFPFVLSHYGKLPANCKVPEFKATRQFCVALNQPFVSSRSLRKTRINWLLRRSRDPEQTAQMHAHSKATLLRHYDQPHHQVSAAEITQFHALTDPSFPAPGPGVCTDNRRMPVPIETCPPEAPQPDCISAEGCLFCKYHRDVMNADYCWRLASHRHLKMLEVNRPGFRRHLQAILSGNHGGGYEQQAVHGRVQGGSGQAGH